MDYQELKNRLEKHNLWLESNGKEGERLVARKENFEGADLSNADLRKADFVGANFEFANLRGADLRGAVLVGANFVGADLRKADLRGAKRTFANFIAAETAGMFV